MRFTVGAIGLSAVSIQVQRMILQMETALARNFDLAPLDLGIVELFDVPAFDADDVIVVSALFQFEDRLAAFEVVPDEESGLFELSENAIHRRESGVGAFFDEHLVNVFRRQMPDGAFLEYLENAQPRHRGFEANRFKVSGRAHGAFCRKGGR